jgi:hypothetical protein
MNHFSNQYHPGYDPDRALRDLSTEAVKAHYRSGFWFGFFWGTVNAMGILLIGLTLLWWFA